MRSYYIGTAHFVSLATAERYYRPYGLDATDVARKVAHKEIFIGKPTMPGKLILLDEGTRYGVEVED